MPTPELCLLERASVETKKIETQWSGIKIMAKLMAVLLKTAKSSLVIYVSKWVNATYLKVQQRWGLEEKATKLQNLIKSK